MFCGYSRQRGKQARGGKRSGDEATASEAGSEAGSIETAPPALVVVDELNEESLREKWETAVDNLGERAKATRAAGLETVLSIVAGRFSDELLEGSVETVVGMIKGMVRKGTLAEKMMGARILAAIFVSVGISQSLYDDALPVLRDYESSRSDELAALGLAARAMGIFVCVEEPGLASAYIVELAKVADSGSRAGPRASAAAMQAISLLLPVVPVVAFFQDHFHTLLTLATDSLDSPDFAVRVAAGKLIASMFELGSAPAAAGFDIDDEVDNRARDELLDKLGDLASESSKYVARETRKSQRSIFRDVLASVEDGTSPDLAITIGKARFTFTSWAALAAYDAVKAALLSGLAAHFSHNPLLTDIFPSISIDNSSLSANRHVKRGADRDAKRDANLEFVHNDL
ncbi:uncharacterized protein AMSG_08287 [Thecamonas trahens ATCC 50062]|uniref:Interferon-related developmental regulator N-terminal domain-containing protein n=1 Tax=Thecamonas trahens ATCC 50062 TaxID=461836 RepID=A0A0L0DI42_THETB|nr:hypothetical protein AMSG_08287 [Thecamonas trahens ATCC 50062]KNC52034.1 hypothetical protein AMSG_08287 [Thecamonas trahens ATCC 50062]|eukprot:XP_013755617.1 hypothetical protein AMSG_08287 [Thecamonas trahens ATCC 50062]